MFTQEADVAHSSQSTPHFCRVAHRKPSGGFVFESYQGPELKQPRKRAEHSSPELRNQARFYTPSMRGAYDGKGCYFLIEEMKAETSQNFQATGLAHTKALTPRQRSCGDPQPPSGAQQPEIPLPRGTPQSQRLSRPLDSSPPGRRCCQSSGCS